MDYLTLLEHSYAHLVALDDGMAPSSRLDYLGDHIFNFTTYDDEMSALFAEKAVEVCGAISARTTFDYILDPENYRWYLWLCNLPFFAKRITWGTSIRGAFWDHGPTELDSCGLFEGDEQVYPIKFTRDEWLAFVDAIVTFSTGGDRACVIA